MMNRHFRLRSELSGAIAKRLTSHATCQKSKISQGFRKMIHDKDLKLNSIGSEIIINEYYNPSCYEICTSNFKTIKI